MRHAIVLFFAVLAASCGGGQEPSEQRYTEASVSVDSETGHVELTLNSGGEGPCPPVLKSAVTVNGVQLDTDLSTYDPNVECNPATFAADGVPLSSGSLIVTFTIPDSGAGHAGDPAEFRIEAPWSRLTTWSDSDFAAAMQDGKEFDVHFTPETAEVPELSLGGLLADGWSTDLDGVTTELVRSASGVATFRFVGSEPKNPWTVVAHRDVFGEVTVCSGFASCQVREERWDELTPGGVAPSLAAGQAPPRECIAAPGKTGDSYTSRNWFEMPPLSSVHVATQPNCAGSSDLYFVLLGGCSADSVGKATYVVGNRGSVASNFHVTSNHETIAGARVEPQGMSKPFEITFDKPHSRLEITADVSDCTPENNVQYVRPEP